MDTNPKYSLPLETILKICSETMLQQVIDGTVTFKQAYDILALIDRKINPDVPSNLSFYLKGQASVLRVLGTVTVEQMAAGFLTKSDATMIMEMVTSRLLETWGTAEGSDVGH